MRQRTSRIVTVAAGLAAAATLAGLPRAQAPRRADAEYLRSAYDTYRSMARSSRYAGVQWQYLGPTNISGRATDIAVADRGSSRRIYAGYATSGVWQTDDNGATWHLDLRRVCVNQHRRSRRRPVEPRRRLGRHGRVEHLSRVDGRRRNLQVDGRRPRVRAHGALRHTDDCAHDRASVESRHGVRRGLRARVDRQRRARRLQDHRRRHARGKRSSTAARAPARSTSSWIQPIPIRSMRRCGSACAASGAIPGSSPATTKGASGRPSTAATAGRRPTPDFPRRSFAGASASTSRARTPPCSTPLSTTTSPAGPRATGSAMPTHGRSRKPGSKRPRCTARTTKARPGTRCPSRTSSCRVTRARTDGCSARSASIRKTTRPSTRWGSG